MAQPVGFLEKIALNLGAIYRHQAAQFPRRASILKQVWANELKPPTTAEVPAIKAHYAALVSAIQSKAYQQLTVREFLIFGAVGLEVLAWFFAGEMIGRRNITGYLVPADYVSKETRRKALEAKQNVH